VVLRTALTAFGGITEFVLGALPRAFVLGYVILMPLMAALALLILLVDLIRWRSQPWTHALGLGLLVRPGPPVAAMALSTRINQYSHSSKGG
jgi:hypothetical protein